MINRHETKPMPKNFNPPKLKDMKSKEINALFSFVSFLHDSAREFSNFNDYASDVTNLVNSPLSFAAKDHNDKMKAKAAMRLRIQEYSTPIIENVEGPIREKLAELGILNGGTGLNLIDFSSAVSEVKNSIYSDISDIEKCKAEYLEVCATITPLREYFFPLFHSIDRILIDELFPYFLPKESITDFNEYRSSSVEEYLPTEEQQGTNDYSTPEPEDDAQPLPPQPIVESPFSVLEWATIFYYADETRLLTESRFIKTRLKQFMSKHQINTTFNNFRTKYYEAKRRINEKNDYPISKLKLIIPFLKENYKQTVTKVENDIFFLEENRSEY